MRPSEVKIGQENMKWGGYKSAQEVHILEKGFNFVCKFCHQLKPLAVKFPSKWISFGIYSLYFQQRQLSRKEITRIVTGACVF